MRLQPGVKSWKTCFFTQLDQADQLKLLVTLFVKDTVRKGEYQSCALTSGIKDGRSIFGTEDTRNTPEVSNLVEMTLL